MDSLCSVEQYLNEVKEDEYLIDVELIDEDNVSYDKDYFGEIGEDELFFVVNGECMFILGKQYLNEVADMVEEIDVCSSFYIDAPASKYY